MVKPNKTQLEKEKSRDGQSRNCLKKWFLGSKSDRYTWVFLLLLTLLHSYPCIVCIYTSCVSIMMMCVFWFYCNGLCAGIHRALCPRSLYTRILLLYFLKFRKLKILNLGNVVLTWVIKFKWWKNSSISKIIMVLWIS